MYVSLKIAEIVSLGFSNMERVQLGISFIAWQWLEDAYVHVFLTSYVYLLNATVLCSIIRSCSLDRTPLVLLCHDYYRQ